MWHKTDFDMLPERAFRPRGARLGKAAAGMTLEGSKGGDVPAPDPALIAAQIKSMGIQDEALQAIMDNTRTMQPLQAQQMQFGLETAKTAYDNAQADRAYSLERRGKLSDQQDQLIQDAADFNSETKQAELAAAAGADVNKAFSNTEAQQSRNLTRMGVNPGSGKFAVASNQVGLAKAAALAGATNNSRTAARAEGRALTDRATNALAGYPAMGMQASGQGAQFGGLGLNYANQGAAGINSGFQTGASVAGANSQGYGAIWNQQQNAYRADQANSGDFFGSLLGAGAQLGAAYIAKGSDRRLKQDIEPVGRDERTGLTLYRFAYKSHPDQHYIGVMADEVERVMPDAVVVMPNGFKAVRYEMLGIEMQKVESGVSQ